MSRSFDSAVREVCVLMRQGYHASASQQLPALSEIWVKRVEALAQQPGSAEIAVKMRVLVNDFKQAQQRSDFLRMADLLEYQILPLLHDAPI